MNKTNDFYFIKTVAEDLNYLMNKWNEEIDDISLRNTSGILRRLLSDSEGNNAYRIAWHKIDFLGMPRVTALDSDALLFGDKNDSQINKIKIAVAGGAKYHGGIIQMFTMLNYAKTPTEVKKDYERQKFLMNNPREYQLKKYLKKTALVVDGIKFTNYDVIDYVTNKLGGVHIDLTRDRKKDDKFKSLDTNIQVKLLDKEYVYYQLLSIGQTIAESSDAKLFIDKAKNLGII